MGQLATAQYAPPATGRPSPSNAASTFEMLEHLVDQAAVFNAFILAEQNTSGGRTSIFSGRTRQTLRRFSANAKVSGSCIKASNEVGEVLGNMDYRWVLTPDDYVAGPRRQPPQVPLNPTIPQRFVMQELRVSFGDGPDGFVGFGTGRTFPPLRGQDQKLALAAVGDILQGFGKFRNRVGNFVISGDLVSGRGFQGNILIRVVDPYGELRSKAKLPPIQPVATSIPETTFLMLRSQKKGPGERSTFSYDAKGNIRGINVPLELKQLSSTFAFSGTDGLMSEISIGEVMGKEVG